MNSVINFVKKLGPGLLFAGAAIGVSHLVQSTRAGADYGFALLWAVILIMVFKYPFFEFGTRYTSSKGESLLEGYKRMSPWVLWAYIILTPFTMFTIQAAVTMVTAGLLIGVFGISLHIAWVSILLLAVCTLLLWVGKYSLLDNFIKIVVILLTICTFIAVVLAFSNNTQSLSLAQEFPFISETLSIAFLIGLMGWMPAPVDMSVWSSIWTEEKQKTTQEDFDYKTSLMDFNVGYWTTLVIAIFFLSLGALVMFNSGIEFSNKSAGFAIQLINLYTTTLGDGFYWLIAIAALATMFSTTLTCLDALPRVMGRAVSLINTPLPEIDDKGTATTTDDIKYSSHQTDADISNTIKKPFDAIAFELLNKKWYWIMMGVLILGSMIIISFFAKQMLSLVQLATILSFLTTPFYALANYLLINSKLTPDFAKPKMGMKILSILGMIFLTGFSIIYIWTLFKVN